jgi:signal transduction histidine kinase
MIEVDYSPQSRTERLIAAGRVVLASSSLLAIWLDPLQPVQYEEEAYGLMAAYVAYAVAIALLIWRSPVALARLRLLMHVIDLAFFAVFVVLTDGPPVSPFSVYFVYSILCATLRWGWPGTLWTTLASLTLFMVPGMMTGHIIDDERLNRFIIRSVYLAVIAVLLGYLGAYEHQLRSEVGRLAAWRRGGQGEPRAVVRDTLAHAARVLGAPRVLLAWDEPEEPWLNVASWTAESFAWERQAPGTFEPLVAAELTDEPFFCPDVRAQRPDVVAAGTSGAFRRWSGAPLDAGLRERHAIAAVLSVRVSGEGYEGRIFFLDKAAMSVDDLMLGRIVAEQVAAQIDHLHLQQRLTRITITEERVRFARDLHDGLLQSLTGTALQLEAIRHALPHDPESARRRLEEIQHLIVAEQRNIRSYIRELRPVALLASRAQADLGATLRALPGRIERQWGLRVDLRISGDLRESEAAGLGHHISHLVHEALVNAARHGGASVASVHVEEREDQVAIAVSDNGRGFAFRGRHGLAALDEMGLGPVTLKERVTALRGSLVVDSGDAGARLEIALPLSAVKA